MTYTVTLVDWPELPEAERSAAESRYRTTLEERLGGAENVPKHHKAFLDVADSKADTVPKHSAQDAAAYIVAQNAADKAGFHGLGHFDGAHFEVRLATDS